LAGAGSITSCGKLSASPRDTEKDETERGLDVEKGAKEITKYCVFYTMLVRLIRLIMQIFQTPTVKEDNTIELVMPWTHATNIRKEIDSHFR